MKNQFLLAFILITVKKTARKNFFFFSFSRIYHVTYFIFEVVIKCSMHHRKTDPESYCQPDAVNVHGF